MLSPQTSKHIQQYPHFDLTTAVATKDIGYFQVFDWVHEGKLPLIIEDGKPRNQFNSYYLDRLITNSTIDVLGNFITAFNSFTNEEERNLIPHLLIENFMHPIETIKDTDTYFWIPPAAFLLESNSKKTNSTTIETIDNLFYTFQSLKQTIKGNFYLVLPRNFLSSRHIKGFKSFILENTKRAFLLRFDSHLHCLILEINRIKDIDSSHYAKKIKNLNNLVLSGKSSKQAMPLDKRIPCFCLQRSGETIHKNRLNPEYKALFLTLMQTIQKENTPDWYINFNQPKVIVEFNTGNKPTKTLNEYIDFTVPNTKALLEVLNPALQEAIADCMIIQHIDSKMFLTIEPNTDIPEGFKLVKPEELVKKKFHYHKRELADLLLLKTKNGQYLSMPKFCQGILLQANHVVIRTRKVSDESPLRAKIKNTITSFLDDYRLEIKTIGAIAKEALMQLKAPIADDYYLK